MNSLDSVSLAINQESFAGKFGIKLRTGMEHPNSALTGRFPRP